jgi:hypothetical protein
VEAHRDLDRLLMRGVDGEATSGGFQGQPHVARAASDINRSRERHKSYGLEFASQRWQPGERFALEYRAQCLLSQHQPPSGLV